MIDSVSGLSARKGAFRLLSAVLWQHRPLDVALDKALSGLEGPDRSLARSIASHALRWLVDLDKAIDSCTRQPLPHDARARLVLRLALAQLWVLKTPPHAVVSTALPLVEAGPRRLVHGILSRLIKERRTLPEQPTLPEPYASRWSETYGAEATQRIARALAVETPLDLAVKNPGESGRWTEQLGGESLAPGMVRLPAGQSVDSLPGYDEGAWWVQDLAAQLPARLLDAKPGEAIADLCAAPGGKTLQLAAAGARVTAVDVSEKRLRRVSENLSRTRLTADVVNADAVKWRPDAPLDGVVLDAPCSATGTVRRHPDVLHLKATRNLEPLLELQRQLVDHAVDMLRPGGRLVYAVCSLEPEEGEKQMEALLARRSDVAVDPISEDAVAHLGIRPDSRGWLRTLPGDLADRGGLDGFFIARLVRR